MSRVPGPWQGWMERALNHRRKTLGEFQFATKSISRRVLLSNGICCAKDLCREVDLHESFFEGNLPSDGILVGKGEAKCLGFLVPSFPCSCMLQ